MKRNALIIGAVAAVAVVLLWYFVLYSPLGDDLSSAQAQVTSEQTKTQDLQATLARLNSQKKNAVQQQALLRKLDAAVPKQPDLAEFILSANRIADDAGIEFLTIAPTPPAAGNGASVIGLTMTVSGSFFQLEDYLRQLEKLDRLVIIDGFNVSASTATSGSGDTSSASSEGTTLSVTLSGRMFTRAAPATSATPGGATTGGDTSTTTTAPGGATSSTTAPTGSSTTGGT
ncbi:MAG: type 4a pilus biogenesis protein PilO [Acidimicrobiia bacterium]